MDFEETKSEILLLSGFSNRLEHILLALLKEHNSLKDRVDKDRAAIMSTIGQVHNELAAENSERKKDVALIQGDMKKQDQLFDDKMGALASKLADSEATARSERIKDRDMLADSIENAKTEFQETLDGVKIDIVSEIKDNIADLGDNLSALEDAIHDDVNKLKNMMCDLGENMEEEKLLRIEDQGKIKESFQNSIGELFEKIKATNDCVDVDLAEMRDNIKTNSQLLENKVDALGQGLENKINSVDKTFNNKLDTTLKNVEDKQNGLILKLEDDLCKLGDTLQDSENKLLERLYEEEEKRMADTETIKNSLEEERFLRGQEAEVMKKIIADSTRSLDETLNDYRNDVNRILEEEKDERAGQHDDMITRLDRERKERIKVNDLFQNQLHDAVDNILTKQMQDNESLKEAIEKEAENQQKLRNDLENEVIKQGKEIFNELDRNRNDFDDLLEKEALIRGKQMNELCSELTNKLDDSLKCIDESHDEKLKQIDEKLTGVKNNFDKNLEEVGKNLAKINNDIDKNSETFNVALEREKSARETEKVKMYEDFEQVCRNIDERITGEKEKLWEKISSTNDSLESMNAQSSEDKNAIFKLLKEEALNREDANEKLKEQIVHQNDSGKEDYEELKQMINKESEVRRSDFVVLSEKLDTDITGCKETSAELRGFLQLENDNRKKEAEALHQKLQKEKEALRDYIDSDNKVLREKLEKDSNSMKMMLKTEADDMRDKLNQENEERKRASEALRKKLEEDGTNLLNKITEESSDLKNSMEHQSSELLSKINCENEARKQEAESIKMKMEKEKQELKDYMEKDSQNLQNKLETEKENLRTKMEREAEALKMQLEAQNKERFESSESMKKDFDKEKAEIEKKMLKEQERLQEKFEQEQKQRIEKEREMHAKMEQSKESSNELIELFDKVKRELDARKQENVELRELLNRETENLFVSFSRGNSEVRDLLEKEKGDLKQKLDDQRNKSVLLEQQLAQNTADDQKGRDELIVMRQSLAELRSLVTMPLSVYFSAVREEAYIGGGEEYLTFSSCPVNSGAAMEPKSGIFTVPVTG